MLAGLGLSLAASRGPAAAVCHSSCTAQLAECKRTCPTGGQGRRDCRNACAERSTCTAPGARIRTLAYVVSDCTTDPQGRSSLQQKLLVRRGNCDPVTVMEAATSRPVSGSPVSGTTGTCRFWGEGRNGEYWPLFFGVLQRSAVFRDGTGVVFEVLKRSPLISGPLDLPQGEGIYSVRADGSGLRRLGPASRFPTISFGILDGYTLSASPGGRRIALVDLGPDAAGHEAPQIFLIDLSSGRRTQLTHQSQVANGTEQPIRFPGFLDERTISFYSGVGELNLPFKSYRVATDGSGVPRENPAPVLVPGARVVAQFAVTGARPQTILVNFPDRQPVNPRTHYPAVFELFLREGKNLIQLTNFGRDDTGFGRSFVHRGRVFFMASANPFGENPAEICQLFSINTRGGDLRQLTRFPSDGRRPDGCGNDGYIPDPKTCRIDWFSLAPDQVTGTLVFQSSCNPLGGNPFGSQIFAMAPDGSGLRQLTATRGMTIDPDGTVHVEMPGPIAYSTFLPY